MAAVRRIVLLPCLFGLIFIIQSCAPKSSDIMVLEVGPKKVSLAEYENFFVRNSGGWDVARSSTKEEREHFLDLLTNYKLKLADAYDHNIQNDSDINAELRDYRTSLASTYLIEHEITEPGIRLLADRRKEEIRARHILLKVAPDASPEETLRVYTKALDLLRQLKNGERFDSLAVKYSEDPSVKTNKGDIYYFSGGVMYAPFENAAYSLHTGETTPAPIRTPFGYHIIQVIDRGPAKGSYKVSHIMARFKTPMNPDSADEAGALTRIKGAADSLAHGWSFRKLAIKISEDAGSSGQGGDLGWFERRRFVQPFDEAVFKLRAGQTSGIVRTPYGFHLIYCDSTKPVPPLTDQKYHDDLRKEYQQRRYNDDYNAYVAKLKQRYHYSLNDSVRTAFMHSLDTTQTTDDSAWAARVPAGLLPQTLFTVGSRTISLESAITALENRPEYRNLILRQSDLRPKLDKMGEAFLFETASANLEQQYPEFSTLMKEYTDGIILYKAEQTEVWNHTAVTDSALKDYYTRNISRFSFPERVNISVLEFESDTLAYQIYDSLKHGADFAGFIMRYAEMPPDPNSQDGGRGLQPAATDTLTKIGATLPVGAITEPVETAPGHFALCKVIDKQPARAKTFEEAGPEVSNAYQEYASKLREQEWLNSIKVRHPVVQHPEVLVDAFRSDEAPK